MKIETAADRHPRMVVLLPAAWITRELAPNETDVHIDDDASLRIRSQLALPPDYGFWIAQSMSRDVPIGGRATLRGDIAHLLSEHGWPVALAHYDIYSEAGELVEQRLGAFYRILHDGAEVVARCHGARSAERLAELRKLLLAGLIGWPTSDASLLYTLLGMDT